MNFTINLDLQSNMNRNKELPLRVRVSINGKHGYIKLGKYIKGSQYDRPLKQIKKGVNGYSHINAYLTKQKIIISKILEDAELSGDLLSFEKLRDIYNNNTAKIKATDFYDYVELTIEYERKYTAIEKSTLKQYLYSNDLIKKYSPKLQVQDIDKAFIEGLVNYYKNEAITSKHKRYKETASYRMLIFLRKYTKKLFKEGVIRKYPFDDYTVGKTPITNFEYLTPDEITKLHNLYDEGSLSGIINENDSKFTNSTKRNYPIGIAYQAVLRYFLASCYTGLRYSDILSLRTSNIQDGYLVVTVKKGRLGKHKTVRVPIRKRLMSLLSIDAIDGFVFDTPVFKNSHTNKILKEVIKIAKIDKNITFHTARHTFATVSLILGLRIETISDILGHAEISTTQRYAHIIDQLRDSEMDNWDKLAKTEFVNPIDNDEIYCPKCENLVMSFEKGVMTLNKISLECSVCGHSFWHRLGGDSKIINMRAV